MALGAGTRLGPYEIHSAIGAGGMGEVYRARDPRIGRDVAIKVLHAEVSDDPDRLRRFQQEVKAAGSLSHPNILAVYDVGVHGGVPYIVSELLEGRTLRHHLTDHDLGRRKVIEHAMAVAHGLAAAHDKGIIHRDLKPENIFITKDGRAKILDFGLAKLTHPEPAEGSLASTVTAETEPGVVMGTVGYMAPEQVRGDAVDHRADLFSFGCILYEMLSGQRAFDRETTPETLTAILKDDPPSLPEVEPDRVVRHCLEKNPSERFRSAHDLAFALEALTGQPSGPVPSRPAPWRRVVLAAVPAALAVVALAAALFLLGERWERGRSSPPVFRQLTFRRGTIYSARFAPDGNTIVYGAFWDGRPVQLFSVRPERPESSPLPLPEADILSISSTGEMAVSLGRLWGSIPTGTLARAPLAGGAPRELLEMVQEAVWNPDGSALAVVRAEGSSGGFRLEYPAGKVLYQTDGWLSHPRFSPQGDAIAFAEHPVKADDLGHLSLVDLGGKKRDLTGHYPGGIQGIAWTPTGDAVWYTAAESGTNLELRAVRRGGGSSRVVVRVPGRLILQDISRDGRVLVTRDTIRPSVMVRTADSDRERDLAWLDWSDLRDLSPDGTRLLLTENGVGGGYGPSSHGTYLRKTDGSPAVRIGDGWSLAVSPDGKWALSVVPVSPMQLVLNPTGPGEARVLPRGNITAYAGLTAAWFGDSRRFVITGRLGQQRQLYVQDIQGGEPRAIRGGEGLALRTGRLLSPDERSVAAFAIDIDRKIRIVPVEGGLARPVPGTEPDEEPAGWTADGRSLYVCNPNTVVPTKIYLVDVASGQRKVWKEIMPADPAGTYGIAGLVVNPDGKSYAYGLQRTLSDLYLVEGLK